MGATLSGLVAAKQSSLTHKYIVDVFNKSPFMQLMDDRLIVDIAQCFEVVKYAKGAEIRTDAHQFFIVAEGTVDISWLTPMNAGGAATTASSSKKSKYEATELLCQRKVGDYICYTSREQLLTRLLLTGPDGAPLATKKKLMKLLDLNKTSADVLVGCTLIKLNRERYDKLRTRLSVRRPYAKHTARFSGGKKSDRAQSIMTAAEKIHLVTSIVESEIVNYLIDIPFLENVEDSRLVTLSNLCSYMFVKGGDVLCSEGEVGDRFFICIRGSLQATVNVHLNAASQTYATLSSDPRDQATNHRLFGSSLLGFERKIQALKRMSTGSYFGEISLLFKIPRIASVTALEDCLLVYIDRATFCNFLKMAPEASLVLLEHVRMHFLDDLIKQGCAFLNAIPPIKLQELSTMSELIERHTGSTVLRKGDRKTAFYILLRGEVEMVYEDDDEGNRSETTTNNNFTVEEGTATEVAAYKEKKQPERVLVRPGGYFGQEAIILRKKGSPVHVTCTDHCLMLKLSVEQFDEFFTTLPEVYSEFCIKCLREKARPEHIMQHFEAHKLWSADCVGRRRHHDVSLFEYIEDFKWEANLLEDRIHERALVIYMKFLSATAPCPVNVSVSIVQAIENELCSQSVDHHIFTMARDEILEGMEDEHFEAFKQSRTFKEFLASLHCPRIIYDALTPEHEELLDMTRKPGRGALDVEDFDGEEESRVASSNRMFRRNSATVFSVANSLASSTMTDGRRGTSTFVVDRPDSIAVGAANRRKTRVEHGPRKISSSFVF
uniref:Cyclic nucleotide-binding domain-containing protein n=1 Tax=Globisporangium ultimum (strain ATCC 200006 / CBS 805.95 / DAOM BR144) TaxID=431595 RepID=K3WTZ4_GLOUD